MSEFPMPDPTVTDEAPALRARLTAPLTSVSVPAVRAGAWLLAALLAIPAIVTLSRMFALIVLSLVLGH